MIVRYLLLVAFFFFSCTSPSPEKQFRKDRGRIIYKVLRKFTDAMEDRGLRAAGIGEGVNHNNGKYNYLGVTFNIESLPNVDFAREMIIEAIQEFLRCINFQEGIENYVDEYPFPLKFVSICIISRNEETGLFSVSNFRDELNYDKHDSGESIHPAKKIHTESYADAVRILTEQS